ncbi:hypothetical protein [Microvirga sp. M2]|uniref:hypothetical protein n=1 Tax=Microvirga sp. M2 TaxID=3073270 RepID=UPI0039C30EF8
MSIDQLRVLTQLQGLNVPEEDFESIAIRLSTWLTAMEDIEAELRPLINAAEPIPPVYPREEF